MCSMKFPLNFRVLLIDKPAVFLYNVGVKKNIDRSAILTDFADHRRGMQNVRAMTHADRLGNSVL